MWKSLLQSQFLQLRLQATTCECETTWLIDILHISFSIKSCTIASIYLYLLLFWGERKKKRKSSQSTKKESKKAKSGPCFKFVSLEPVVYSLTLYKLHKTRTCSFRTRSTSRSSLGSTCYACDLHGRLPCIPPGITKSTLPPIREAWKPLLHSATWTHQSRLHVETLSP